MKIQVLIENTGSQPELVCEHGLSLYIETGSHRILFDAGQSDSFAANAAAMGVDLAQVDMAVLSHGHYDHGGGLAHFLQINHQAPVYVSAHAFECHYNAADKYIGLDPALQQEKRLIPVAGDRVLDDSLSLHTCAHHPIYVPADSFGLTAAYEGQRIPDDFRHEQYLLVREGERKILFSGCSHRGILNIVRWFEPDVLVGGFHFMKLDPTVPVQRQRLEAAAEELLRHRTRYYTGHCTGVAQYALLKQRMGDRLQYLSTGCSVTL